MMGLDLQVAILQSERRTTIIAAGNKIEGKNPWRKNGFSARYPASRLANRASFAFSASTCIPPFLQKWEIGIKDTKT